ncbi:MAG: GNAT family N-acetyltransferase [Candidatus Peregrinibacteria bacterium]
MLARQRMAEAAKARKFEQAARFRDVLANIRSMQEKQIVSDTSGEDLDVIGVAVLGGRANVVLLQVRSGRVIADKEFPLTGRAETVESALEQFLQQYYHSAPEIPPVIVMGAEPAEKHVLGQWLREQRKGAVEVRVPERGKKSKLLALAEENAVERMRSRETRWEAEARNIAEALRELKDLLNLPAIPRRIEGYDISHLSGTETSGSMVVALDGKAANDLYRSFAIRTLKRGDVDDYRALQEVIRRRLRHLISNLKHEENQWKTLGYSFGPARKNEETIIEHLMREEPEHLSLEDMNYRDFFVARKGENIVALGRFLTHAKNEVEMKSIWVHPAHRNHGLGTFMIRKLLQKAKKMKLKKIYIRIFLPMEEFYAELGFRRAENLPPVLGEKVRKIREAHPDVQGTTMVYLFAEHREDPSLSARPDLLVIDGGKGQVSAVVRVLTELNIQIPVIGLAKQEEQIFVPDDPSPVPFPEGSQAKYLLMRIRNEAHRFANKLREAKGKNAAFQISSPP